MDDAEKQKIAAIEAAWNSDKTRQEIKFEFDISYSALQKLAQEGGWKRKPMARRAKKEKDNDEVGPSPAEIEQRAAEVRKRWTPAEKERRWVGPRRQTWVPRQYTFNAVTKLLEVDE